MNRVNRTIRIAIVVALAVCAVGFATRREFYVEALVGPFFAFALVSVLILHLRVRPRWIDAALVALCTLLLAFIDLRLLHYQQSLAAWLSFIGVSSLLVLAADCVLATKKEERTLLFYAWVPAFLFLVSEWFASNMLDWVTTLHPKTLDLYLLSFDATLHVQLSFVVGRAYASWHWLHTIGLICYVGLAIPITLIYAGRLTRFGARAFSAMLAFLITGPVGILFYNIFPACGPIHLVPRLFPYHPPALAQMPRLLLEPVAITGARNAIPSLHLAWTLLAWWYSRGLSWWERSIAFAFLAFTAAATMGTGEHYFVDLVVAFPFALMIQALCSYELPWSNSSRLQAIGIGFGATMLWFALLRFVNRLFWTSPVVPWALVIATIALVTIRQRELARAAADGQEADSSVARASARDLAPGLASSAHGSTQA